MTDLNSKLLTDVAIEMMDQIAESASVSKTYGAEAPESVTRSYTYESTNKKGQKVTKQVVRKYTNKKNTTNTLQNKTNKDTVIKNINDHYDEIIKLPEHKRLNYIKTNCLPDNVSASYNTLKSLWKKIYDSASNSPSVKEDHQ